MSNKSRYLKFFSCAALFGAMFIASMCVNARAAQLVMFQQAGCAWCEAFNREVAPVYGKTDEGALAPLRRLDIAEPLSADLAFIGRERFTPLFVLVDKGHEIGRIRGYPGDYNFWGMLGALIKRLDTSGTSGEHVQDLEKTLPVID